MARLIEPADFDELMRYFQLHGEPMLSHQLPPTGFCVPGVAACWLIKTDAGLGIIDAMVTNPEAPASHRSAAIDLVTTAILAEARRSGLGAVLGITENQGLVARAVERHGFTYAGLKHGLSREL